RQRRLAFIHHPTTVARHNSTPSMRRHPHDAEQLALEHVLEIARGQRKRRRLRRSGLRRLLRLRLLEDDLKRVDDRGHASPFLSHRTLASAGASALAANPPAAPAHPPGPPTAA